ncbi:MAG TPA: winged helix-turn-helix transcriptional regulator [Nitrolancea sp.]|nr:winged helix-turn-helix transcriptional regulator [Nitrolancea sp.]
MSTQTGPNAVHGITRRQVLTTLKKSDGLTADQLSVLLGITSMAVRKHLSALERDGLIESTVVRRPVGRPVHVYRLSVLAEDFFPKHYHVVITDLLSDLLELDGEQKVELLLARRAERTRHFLAERVNKAGTFEERVEALAEGMDELGYLAAWERIDDSTYMIRQFNCAIQRVATCFPVVCQYESESFGEILDADVERCSHILAGDCMCGYLIRDRKTYQGTARPEAIEEQNRQHAAAS